MTTMRTAINLSALALVLSAGWIPLAGAQQEFSPDGRIQLYSRPITRPEGTPALPEPRPLSNPYAEEESLPEPPPHPDSYAEEEVLPEPPPRPHYQPRPDPYAEEPPLSQPQPRPNPYAEEPPLSQPPPRPNPYTGSSVEYAPAVDSADDAGPGWSPPGGSLQVQDYQGVRYVSGGIGEGERAELGALSGQFNLKLLFAMQGSGDYLADLQVRILDARGGVALNAKSDGPWFFARLAPGAYTVEVSALGQTQRQTARIGSSPSQLYFYWR